MRVVIAEDSVLLREGITRLLAENDATVVAALSDASRLLATVRETSPDLVIVDVRMPPTFTDEGLRAAVELRSVLPATPVLVLSQYVEERFATELLGGSTVGVGYLLKERVADVSDFISACRRVAIGGTALDPDVVAQLLVRSRRREPLASLTPRGARGARPDGRGVVQRRHRPAAQRRRGRGREAHHLDHVEAVAEHERDRSPPGARRAHLSRIGLNQADSPA